MAAKLGWVNYISIDGAEPVLLDTLSAEQRQKVDQIMSERISRVLSTYFSNHPEELKSVFRDDEIS